MKGSMSSGCYTYCALLLVVLSSLASEAAARGYPLQQVYGRNSYYQYTANPSLTTYYPQRVPLNRARSFGLPREPYQRYMACEPRTFSYEDCTLCFCTDRRNIGLCWDDDEQKCAQTRKLADEQRNLKNNDPHGVW